MIGQFFELDRQQEECYGFVIIMVDVQGGMVDVYDWWFVVFFLELVREWVDGVILFEWVEQMVLQEGEVLEVFIWYCVDCVVGNVCN